METQPARTPQQAYPDISMSRSLAKLTDDLVKVPGTNFGVGIDALVGLIPGVGDFIGTGLSSAIMVDAVRQRVPLNILARMGWNLLIDTGLGFIPVAGDAADVLHRANRKNYRLLEKAVAEDKHVASDMQSYTIRAVIVVTLFIATSLAMIALIVWGLATGIGTLFG